MGWLAGEGVRSKQNVLVHQTQAQPCSGSTDTFVDSDWAGEQKYSHTRSRTGVIILLNRLPVFWRSNKQPEIAISSA